MQYTSNQRPPSIAGVVYQKNAKSIVMIETTDQSGTIQGSGVAFRNGVVQNVDKTFSPGSTWIITNGHVVKNASVVNVIIDGIPSKANVKYRDSEFDIAIVFAEHLVITPVDKPAKELSVT